MEDIIKDYNFFHNFIESLPCGVIILDSEGKIFELNRNLSFMLNLGGVEPAHSHYGEVMNPELKSVFDRLIEEIKMKGLVTERQLSVSLAGGVEIAVAVSGSLLMAQESSNRGIIIICREMTAKQELERMRELEKLKSNFISTITHDLKAPLTSIIGYADLLSEAAADKLTTEETEYLNIVRQEGMHLNRMVSDILNVARIESGRLQIKPEPASLKEIIDDVIKVAAVQGGKFNFVINIDDTIKPLWLDKELMTRVFMNLVSNAIKYSPQGGRIAVEAYIKEFNVHVEVKDQGMGMSSESLSHLFEKFFRVKSDATKGISGTGLGLVITRGIVEAHGGILSVASEPGKGTTFSVILPVRLADKKPDS